MAWIDIFEGKHRGAQRSTEVIGENTSVLLCAPLCFSSKKALPPLRMILFMFLFSSSIALAQEINIGIPAYSSRSSFLTDQSPQAFILRAALTRPLFTTDSRGGNVQMELAQGFVVHNDNRGLDVTLRSGIRFSSGDSITVSDLLYSLRGCAEFGPLPYGVQIKQLGQYQDTDRTVRIKIDEEAVSIRLVLIGLSRCPVLHRSSSEAFGAELGQGSNIVSSGRYLVERFRDQFSVHLKRVKGGDSESGDLMNRGVSQIKLRAIAQPEQSLAALRAGGIDLFFTSDQGVMERVQKDETLVASRCSIYYVAHRKGVRLNCGSRFEIDELGYDDHQRTADRRKTP